MALEVGELVVGAYLKEVLYCDVVDYNVRPPTGQHEFDVIGLQFGSSTAILCEVATHLDGLNYGHGNQDTLKRVVEKYRRQRDYAERYLSNFDHHRFMLWAPYVPRGFLTTELRKVDGLELAINGAYAEALTELRALAQKTTRNTGNEFFRTLQIIEHVRG